MRDGNEGSDAAHDLAPERLLREAGLRPGADGRVHRRRSRRRADVPRDWVVLQERHLALAFQGRSSRPSRPDARAGLLTSVLRRPPAADVDDPVAVQGELRSTADEGETARRSSRRRRSRSRTCTGSCSSWTASPATRRSLMAPRRCVHGRTPPTALAERMLDAWHPRRGADPDAQPARGRGRVRRVPSGPRASSCWPGPSTTPSSASRSSLAAPTAASRRPWPGEAFWEATCVVAAHQHLRSSGRPGYVDREGRLETGFPDGEARIRWFRDLGARRSSATAALAVSG